MYSNNKTFKTLNHEVMPQFMIKAQIAELDLLKKIILEKKEKKEENKNNKEDNKLKILDIGIGDARVPIALSQNRTVWDSIGIYDGIDNSPQCLSQAKVNLKKLTKSDLPNKIKLIQGDATNLHKLNLKTNYDLIFLTYFTAGNFKPTKPVKTPVGYYQPLRSILNSASKLLTFRGEIILGSIYVDTAKNGLKQKQFYEECEMNITSNSFDPYTSTKEGFWSLRFNIDKFTKYFSNFSITTTKLDSDNFAVAARMMEK